MKYLGVILMMTMLLAGAAFGGTLASLSSTSVTLACAGHGDDTVHTDVEEDSM